MQRWIFRDIIIRKGMLEHTSLAHFSHPTSNAAVCFQVPGMNKMSFKAPPPPPTYQDKFLGSGER